MNRKRIRELIGNIIFMAIVIAVTIILTKPEMSCRTLLIEAIAVLVGAGMMTGWQYYIDRKNNNKQKD